MITRTCSGKRPQTVYFKVYAANFARISGSELSDFETDEGAYQPTAGEIESIVNGYNANVPTE